MSANLVPGRSGDDRSRRTFAERRRAPRIEILDRLHGHVVSLGVPVTVCEISLGGLTLESPVAFPPGAVHDFRVRLGDNSTVVLKARVVHCQAMPPGEGAEGSSLYRTGVAFIGDGSDADAAVEHLLNSNE